MSNPPPQRLPKAFLDDPEVRLFMDALIKTVYFNWAGFDKAVGFYGNQPISQPSALTASDTNTPNSGDATTDAIIANLQTRVDELEAILDSSTGIGVLP